MTDPVPEASVGFAFEAAFRTPLDPHPVAGSFRAEVVTTGSRDPACGGARDPAEVKMLVGDLRKALHGRYLNAATGLSAPTLENLARWLWGRLEAERIGLARVVLRRGDGRRALGVSYAGRPRAPNRFPAAE